MTTSSGTDCFICTRWQMMIVLISCSMFILSHAGAVLKEDYWKKLMMNPLREISYRSDNLHNLTKIRHHFTRSELKRLNRMVTNFLIAPTEEMWDDVPVVSTELPFILFHQRKAGGSSLRLTLQLAAWRLNLPAYIPCNTLDCDVYTFPREERYAVYGGHFKWGSQGDLAIFNKTFRSQYSCATNYRHPISRFESCLYYRFVEELHGRCLMDLSSEEFRALLFKTDVYGTSCLNEPFRILSGVNDEEVLDHLMGGSDETSPRYSFNYTNVEENDGKRRFLRKEESVVEHSKEEAEAASLEGFEGSEAGRRRLVESYALEIFNLTLRHTRKCPPIILELPETYDIMSKRIPSLGDAGGFQSSVMDQVGGKSRKKCSRLSGGYLEQVEELAALEMMLYDAVVRKALMQIALRYPDYLFHMRCMDDMNKRDYLPLDASRGVPVALIGLQGSDVTNIRSLLEYSTGVFTGTVRARKEYIGNFPAEPFCGKRMIAIFAEIGTFRMLADPNENYAATFDLLLATSKRKCRRGMIAALNTAAILSRDPFMAMYNHLKVFNTTAGFDKVLHRYNRVSEKNQKVKPTTTTATSKAAQRTRRRRQLLSSKKHKSPKGERSHSKATGKAEVPEVVVPSVDAKKADAPPPPPVLPKAGNARLVIRDSALASPQVAATASTPPPNASEVKQEETKITRNQNVVLPSELFALPPTLNGGNEEEEDLEASNDKHGGRMISRFQNGTYVNGTHRHQPHHHRTHHASTTLLTDVQNFGELSEQQKEYLFFEDNFALLMDWYTYSWLFRDYYYKYQELHNNERSDRKMWNELFQAAPIPKYPGSRFQLFSYEAVYEGAYLLSNHSDKHTTFYPKNNTVVYKDTMRSVYNPQNNAFWGLVSFTGYTELLRTERLGCAYSFIKSSDRLVLRTLDEVHSMREFYAQHPQVLADVKQVIKLWLKNILLEPSQVHFSYPLL